MIKLNGENNLEELAINSRHSDQYISLLLAMKYHIERYEKYVNICEKITFLPMLNNMLNDEHLLYRKLV